MISAVLEHSEEPYRPAEVHRWSLMRLIQSCDERTSVVCHINPIACAAKNFTGTRPQSYTMNGDVDQHRNLVAIQRRKRCTAGNVKSM